MKNINFKGTDIFASQIGVGCMRIDEKDSNYVNQLINESLECGINFFDHADIYGDGVCEEIFGKALSMDKSLREKIIIQSKCGIRSGYFDFSKEYIIRSVDGILKRLNVDYIDILLLHRPDALMEPLEVAEAFDVLESSGKVKSFGVSNQNSYQIELLQKYVNQKLTINQLQYSITNCNMVKNGINVNMENDEAVCRDGSVLDYCRLKDITIQNWSPFQYGFFEGTFLNNDKFPVLNKKIDELAEKYSVTNSAIAVSWILRHPAQMQPIIGTTNIKRIKDISKATEFSLDRKEWYDIYKAAGNILP
ncbi:MAG: aldo/keto reductase [Oscillospiraceae bacterium]